MRCEEIAITAGGQQAKLHTYFWENSKELNDGLLRPIVIICPGGGYAMTSDREAEGLAVKFVAMGHHAAVLRYSVTPVGYPASLLELAQTVKLVREHQKEWYIHPNKIIIQGSSAGGHLAASLGVFWKKGFLAERLNTEPEMIKPNGLILSYPVITSKEYAHRESFRNLLGDSYEKLIHTMSLEDQVTKDMPKTFIWTTYTDQTVPAENSLLFVQALRNQHISTEFHMYPVGVHGMGTAGKLTMGKDGLGIQKECESWIDLAGTWLEHI